MGYAIFTARKLMLTNRINQISFRLLQLSQQKQTLAQATGDKQRALAYTKSIFNNMGQQAMMGYQSQQMQLGQQLSQPGLTPERRAELSKLLSDTYQNMNGIGNIFNSYNSYMDMASSYELQFIKDKETQIDLEMKTLETQQKAMTAELQEVEKKEDSEIKNSAPKFA